MTALSLLSREQLELLRQAFEAGFRWHSSGMGHDAYNGAPIDLGFEHFVATVSVRTEPIRVPANNWPD